MKMFARMHRMGGDTILAVCDKEVLGTTLEGGGRRMTVSEAFYKGAPIDEEELAVWMRSAASMNIVGNKAVSVAIREGYAEPEQVFEMGGVKYLMVVIM